MTDAFCVRKCEDHIITNLKDKFYETVDWFHLVEDGNQQCAVVNTAITFRVP
jgi:hypothetical protein